MNNLDDVGVLKVTFAKGDRIFNLECGAPVALTDLGALLVVQLPGAPA